MSRNNGDRDYPLSASQLKTFKSCPKKYWFNYKSDIDPTKAPKGYRSMGGAVHEAIEEVLGENPDLRDEEQLNYRFEAEIEEKNPDYPDSMHDTALTCLSNAARFIEKEAQPFNIRGIEVDHTFGVNRPDISHDFRAIMDVCTETEIWDWKTGNKREGDERIQAAIYLAAYSHKYGEVPEAIRFIYLKDRDQSVHSRTDGDGYEFWSEDEEPDGWEESMRIAKEVLRAWRMDEWPARPDDSKCYWCDYEGFCEYSKVGAGGITWEKY